MAGVLDRSSRFHQTVLIILLIAALALSVSSSSYAQESPTATQPTTFIPAKTVRAVDVYSGPGTTYPRVGTLPPETDVQVAAVFEDGTWLYLILTDASGDVFPGWIRFAPNTLQLALTDLETLPLIGTPTPTPPPTASPTFTASAAPTATSTPFAAATLAGSTLTETPALAQTATQGTPATTAPTSAQAFQSFLRANRPTDVHAEPNTDSAVLQTLTRDMTATIVGASGDRLWLQITLSNEALGWVAADPAFISIFGDAASLPVTDGSSQPTEATEVAIALTLPAEATEAADIIATPFPVLPTATLPTLDETPFLPPTASFTPTLGTPEPTSVKPTTASGSFGEIIGIVAGNNQPKVLRTAPNTDSDMILLVRRGTRVVIVAEKAGTESPNLPWYNVRLPDGTMGWLRSDTVTVLGTPTPAFTPPTAIPGTPTASPTFGPTRTGTPAPPVDWPLGTQLLVTNPNGVWLRDQPASNSINATLANNNLVTSTGNFQFAFDQWWWEVRADWGATGWVEQTSLAQP